MQDMKIMYVPFFVSRQNETQPFNLVLWRKAAAVERGASAMEAFDPLSLFSAPERKQTGEEEETDHNDEDVGIILTQEKTGDEIDISYEDLGSGNDDLNEPLHILDLPVLGAKPPYVVLFVLLRLLAPQETLNFGPSTAETKVSNTDEKLIFTEHGVLLESVQEAVVWLKDRYPRLDSIEKLSQVSVLALGLRNNYQQGYFSYMTRIVSSDLEWISNEIFRGVVQKEASLRISESCGRTAQPEIIRKIVIDGLAKIHSGEHIRLKEPTLTSDNLGLKTWGSSLVLAQRLIRCNSEKQYLQSPVLELGSGTGLVGMASCILGHMTYLTDLKEIVPNLKDNVELNDIKNGIVHELDWTDVTTFTLEFGKVQFPTILVSDPIYLEQHPYFLMNAIREMVLQSREARVLIQIPLRPKYEKERALLWSLMEEIFVLVEEEIEHGYDDFGAMSFCFRMYKFRP